MKKGATHPGAGWGIVVSPWSGSILPEVQRAFERSPEWQEFQGILLEVAEAQACAQEDESRAEANISEPVLIVNQEIDWEDITILFLSEERVQVDGGQRAGTYNYAEMGFGDKRSGKPNQAWGMLRTLGRAGGVIPNAARDSKDLSPWGNGSSDCGRH